MKKIEKRNIHYAQKKKNATVEFEIKQLDELLNYSDSFGKLHKHDFYFILFMTEGNSLQTIDFKTEQLSSKQILFMYPGQAHGFKYKKGSKGYSMYFTNDFLNNPNSSAYKIHQLVYKYSQIITLDNQQLKEFQTLFNTLFKEFNSENINRTELLKAYNEIILTKLLRLIDDNLDEYLQSSFSRIVALKEEFFCKNIAIKEISQNIGLSQKKLNALSKSYFGKTFLQLLNERKLLEVKRLLTTTDFSIKEIAYHSGFSDSAYLNNFFKKHTGLTPLQFKKKT